MKNTMRVLIHIVLLCFIIIIAAYGYAYYQNNKPVDAPSDARIQATFDKAVDWLDRNRSRILQEHNPALWWMIKEAADTSQDTRLASLFQQYKREHLDRTPSNIWTPFFNPTYKPYVPDIVQLSRLQPYQLFFVYALSCDEDLGNEPVIKQQLSPDYCQNHFLHPRCITHQQMGVRLLQQRQCGSYEKLPSRLLDIIESEITWDFRVTDSYIQRALMLAEGGEISKIKPVWIQRILNAQLADGSWSDFYPVLSIAGKQIGFTSTLPAIGPQAGNFHATAQGIWLTSLLLRKQ